MQYLTYWGYWGYYLVGAFVLVNAIAYLALRRRRNKVPGFPIELERCLGQIQGGTVTLQAGGVGVGDFLSTPHDVTLTPGPGGQIVLNGPTVDRSGRSVTS